MKDINRRSEPKTVALRLRMECNQRTVWALSLFFFPQMRWSFLPLSIRSYKMLGFDTTLFFLPSAAPRSNGRKQGLAGGSVEAGWMELLWLSVCGDEVSVWPTLKVNQVHVLTQQLHSRQHV